MTGDPEPRYILTRITPTEWVINDQKYAENDPRHLVACIYEYAETEVEVVWLRDLPLAVQYSNAYEVLEDVARVKENNRATRPIAIPHLPPLLAT